MSYVCSSCHGTVHVTGRTQTIEKVREVHEATCPAVLRLGKKK